MSNQSTANSIEKYLDGIRQAYNLFEVTCDKDKMRLTESELERLLRVLIRGETPGERFAKYLGLNASYVRETLAKEPINKEICEQRGTGEFDPKVLNWLLQRFGIRRETLASYVGVSKSLVDKWCATHKQANSFFPHPESRDQREFMQSLDEVFGYDPYNIQGMVTSPVRKKKYK